MSKGFITGTNEELIKAYKESRDESYLKELIEANKGLINLLVSPYLTSIPNSELEDLTSESYIPMLRAIEDYDPEQGVAFSTLLKVYVRQHLNRLYNEATRQKRFTGTTPDSLDRLSEINKEGGTETDSTFEVECKGEVGVKDGETDYDFPIYEVHKLDVDGSGRDRTCLCKGESCEFCKSGNKPQLRMFLQMINKDEKDKDKQVQLWERGLTDIKNLIGLAGEYGDLTKRDIKIKRSGAKGSLKTTYQYFPKDPSEMEIPEPQNLVGSLILDLDREDQIKAIEGRLQLNKGNNNDSNNDSGAGATRVF